MKTGLIGVVPYRDGGEFSSDNPKKEVKDYRKGNVVIIN